MMRILTDDKNLYFSTTKLNLYCIKLYLQFYTCDNPMNMTSKLDEDGIKITQTFKKKKFN